MLILILLLLFILYPYISVHLCCTLGLAFSAHEVLLSSVVGGAVQVFAVIVGGS